MRKARFPTACADGNRALNSGLLAGGGTGRTERGVRLDNTGLIGILSALGGEHLAHLVQGVLAGVGLIADLRLESIGRIVSTAKGADSPAAIAPVVEHLQIVAELLLGVGEVGPTAFSGRVEPVPGVAQTLEVGPLLDDDRPEAAARLDVALDRAVGNGDERFLELPALLGREAGELGDLDVAVAQCCCVLAEVVVEQVLDAVALADDALLGGIAADEGDHHEHGSADDEPHLVDLEPTLSRLSILWGFHFFFLP